MIKAASRFGYIVFQSENMLYHLVDLFLQSTNIKIISIKVNFHTVKTVH
jgi:hypothetical protein